jgi:hypothetical protein
VNADVKLYASLYDGNQKSTLEIDPKRKGYVHLIKGSLEVNGENLNAGDALMIAEEDQINISHGKDAEVLVFDLHEGDVK